MSLILSNADTKPHTTTDIGPSPKYLITKTSFLNKRQLTETYIYNPVEHIYKGYKGTFLRKQENSQPLLVVNQFHQKKKKRNPPEIFDWVLSGFYICLSLMGEKIGGYEFTQFHLSIPQRSFLFTYQQQLKSYT